MSIARRLPVDERGFTHILFSALGGDGANMSAKLLFRIAVEELGLDGAYDAKYGSEKTGTATDVSLRLCRDGSAIRESGPTNRPHALVVFHSDLIRPLGLGRGLRADALVVCNTTEPPAAMRERLALHSGSIRCVDAERIARTAGSRLNVPLVAVVAQALGFPMSPLWDAIERAWPRARQANLTAFRGIEDAVIEDTFAADGRYPLTEPLRPDGPIGYLNMLDGGAIDARYFTTVGRDNRIAGRGLVPDFNVDACIGCAICLTVCSDAGGLIWEHDKVTGIDTAFCKGCMRCVEVCPATGRGQALTLPQSVSRMEVWP
jgi:pyruvate ferredoxin oxidoreductase gamma subunit